MERFGKKNSVVLFVFFFMEALTVQAAGWPDGKREGFLLGVHGVYGTTSFSNGSSTSGSTLGGGIYIGYGFTEQLSLTFRVRYAGTDADGFEHNTVMWSADLCYFFLPQEGIYVNAGVGPVLDAPEFGDPLTGFGAYAGVGWEFTQYLSVGADVSVASVSNDYSDVSGTAFLIFLKFLAY